MVLAQTDCREMTLPYGTQFDLLRKPWANAFSTSTNLQAWKSGGFGAEGITQAPLWKQRRDEQRMQMLHQLPKTRSRSTLGLTAVQNDQVNEWLASMQAPWECDFSTSRLQEDLEDPKEREDECDAGQPNRLRSST